MRLLIVTSSRFGTASCCLPLLNESARCAVVRVILCHARPKSRWRRLRSKIGKTLRIGLFGALNGIRMRQWYDTPGQADIAEICERLSIPFFETDVMASDAMAALVREAEADLGLSLGNSYIPARIFEIPRLGMINVHGERLPDYQNAQSVIWPIHNMETKSGITVHRIDRGIDTGAILYKEEFQIIFRERLEDTVRATLLYARERLPPIMRYVCDNFDALVRAATVQDHGRKYTTPTLREFMRMRRNNRLLHLRANGLDVA